MAQKKKKYFSPKDDQYKKTRSDRKTTNGFMVYLKEFADNALDAGASTLEIAFKNAKGLKKITSKHSYISLWDNGHGLPFSEKDGTYDWGLLLSLGSKQLDSANKAKNAGCNGVGFKESTMIMGNKFLAVTCDGTNDPEAMYVDYTRFQYRDQMKFEVSTLDEILANNDIPAYIRKEVEEFQGRDEDSYFYTTIFETNADPDPSEQKALNNFWTKQGSTNLEAIMQSIKNGEKGSKGSGAIVPMQMYYPKVCDATEEFKEFKIVLNGEELPQVTNPEACYFIKVQEASGRKSIVFGGEDDLSDPALFDPEYASSEFLTTNQGNCVIKLQTSMQIQPSCKDKEYYLLPGGIIPMRGRTVASFGVTGTPWTLDTNFSRRFVTLLHWPDVREFDKDYVVDKNKVVAKRAKIKQSSDPVHAILKPYFNKIQEAYKDIGGTTAEFTDREEMNDIQKALGEVYTDHFSTPRGPRGEEGDKSVTTTPPKPIGSAAIRGFTIAEHVEDFPKEACEFEESKSGNSVRMHIYLKHPAVRRDYSTNAALKRNYVSCGFAGFLALKEPKEEQFEKYKELFEVFKEALN